MSETSVRRPEDLRFLSGVILVSTEPARLVRFYRDTLGVPLAEERHGDSELHWACELGDVHFAIHPAVDYPGEATTAGAVKIAFMVFELDPLVERRTRTSPGRPCASTWRAYSSSAG